MPSGAWPSTRDRAQGQEPSLLNQLKSVLQRAASARTRGEAAEAERLFKEAAAQAEADQATDRAEALTGVAQARRDKGDRLGASIYYAEAITLFRTASATNQLAHTLRHAAEIRSEMKEYGVAGTQIEEAIRLYRSQQYSGDTEADPLDLADALRISARNDERRAQQAWAEVEQIFTAAGDQAGADEARAHAHRAGTDA